MHVLAWQWIWDRRSSLATIACLLTIGALGHRYHWSWPSHVHEEEAGSHGERGAGNGQHSMTETAATDAKNGAPPGEGVIPDENGRTVHFESAEAVQRNGIQLHTVEPEPWAEYVEANGVVGYDQTRLANLSAKVPGSVWRVEKKVGDPIARGEVLALIESVEVGKAKADYLSAIAHLNYVETRLHTLETAGDVIAKKLLRETQAAVYEARIQLYNTHQVLTNLGLTIDMAAGRSLPLEQLHGKVQFLGLPPEITAQLDPGVTTANLLPLLAPFDGMVVGREVVLGEVVMPTQPQFVIADCRRLWITLNVKIEDAPRLAVGQQVLFQADGVDHEVQCELSWISPEMDERTRMVEVRADADNPLLDNALGEETGQRKLHVNSFGTGRVRTLWREAALTVPNEALQFDGDSPLVFVAKEDLTFEAVPVELGVVAAERSEVREGLAPGDRVVTTGSLLLKSQWQQQDHQPQDAVAAH